MSGSSTTSTARVAILVDCDNVSPEVVEFALQKIAGLGRLVIRRGYGTHTTLGKKWQEMLVREAFTPHLQYAYVPGKNTTDIALALDAMEILLDGRADTFCLVSSDSDFAYLCRKLRERGASVVVAGDAQSPMALRKACDQFFEGKTTSVAAVPAPVMKPPAAPKTSAVAAPKAAMPVAKKPPTLLVDAVRQLASQSPGGKVGGTELGQYLSKTHPGFKPKTYGHAGLKKMVKSHAQLALGTDVSGNWAVTLVQPKPTVKAAIQVAPQALKPATAVTLGKLLHPAPPASAPRLE
ncbi:NYN domain-containing protein [Stenotrophomonas lacuserhaii]|uniref:NYN domain-containing protein n=1 Tax=Stenotrophomonas lacuserhaii TaxID=2760084 RepID=UPI0015FD0D16|nr:NYN domain-containing protein [Stenotrophomonas lacuserhaii]